MSFLAGRKRADGEARLDFNAPAPFLRGAAFMPLEGPKGNKAQNKPKPFFTGHAEAG